ncbi:hypothetical protein ACQ4PT_011539 [Festuca glaucescens]
MVARTLRGADPGGGDPLGCGGSDSLGGRMDSSGDAMDSCGGEHSSSGRGSSLPYYSWSPEHSATVALARAVLASPVKTSHRWGTSLGGVDLDDDIWEIRFNFHGEDNLERTLSRSDIIVLNLMALIQGHCYGFLDTMYYVKDKGKGFEGMEAVNSMAKVEQMLQLFEEERLLKLTVIRHNATIPTGLNKDDMQDEFLVNEPTRLSVDKDGVTYITEDEEEAIYPVVVDYSDVLYVATQQSSNLDKGKGHVDVIDTDDEIFGARNMGQYRPEEDNRAVEPEHQLQKKQRMGQKMHIEGDTDVEELYEDEEESEPEEVPEEDLLCHKKKVAKPGPTSRCHHEPEHQDAFYFVPSNEEELSHDELEASDDDVFVSNFVLPSGAKRRLKKMKKRVWYDHSKADAHEQFALKLCFRDVYQFRVALRNFHIAQLRNYAFHRNTRDRIIVECSEEGYPFLS